MQLTHLYRGAPAVRSWSQHQRTNEEWTLCGIDRRMALEGAQRAEFCTEDASLVVCPRCLELMRPSRKIPALTTEVA